MPARTAAASRLPIAAVETFPATEDDPVLAAIRRAPPMSPAFRDRARALDAGVENDPSTWIPEEQFLAELAAARGRHGK
jgi:hypothetical protein